MQTLTWTFRNRIVKIEDENSALSKKDFFSLLMFKALKGGHFCGEDLFSLLKEAEVK